MKFTTAILLGSSVLLAAATAQAQETVTTRSGFYLGGALGYGHNDLDLATGPTGGAVTANESQSMSSGEFGIVGGYRFNLPNRFFMDTEGDFLISHGEKSGLFGTTMKVEKGYQWGLYVKPGYNFTDQFGAFVTLGMGQAKYEFSDTGYSHSDKSTGFVYGAGVNYQLAPEVSVTAEYNRLEGDDISATNGGTTTSMEPTVDVGKVALKYHF